MKNLIILSLLCFVVSFSQKSFSQKPEKVYSIVVEEKNYEWYKTQVRLWKKEIDKNKNNKEAWLYYYTANRMARMTNNEGYMKGKGRDFDDLNSIVENAGKAIPNTFEYYYIKHYNSGSWDEASFKDLFKAYELGPDRVEILDEMAGYYEIKRDLANRKIYSKKWYEKNGISPYILNFNYNVLLSMEDNGIILTNGDNDTYPIWILQDALGIKSKVTLINLSLIMIDWYREALFKELGLPPLRFDPELFKNESYPYTKMVEVVIRHLVNNVSRPLYFALTLQQDYFKGFEKNTYLVGLAFKYSKTDFDNMALLRKNYEKNFLVDYLKMNFYNDISVSVAKTMNLCYLPVFIKLSEHYKMTGETDKANELKKIVMKLASDTDKEEYINNWIRSFDDQ